MPDTSLGRFPGFWVELRNFLRFVVSPNWRRLPGRSARRGWLEDWFPKMPLTRLLQWAALLWGINMVVLGPIAVAAAGMGGAEHRLMLDRLPWLQAILWAPIVEELTFRYVLRSPARLWWLLPAAVCALLVGPGWQTALLVAATMLACWWPHLSPHAVSLQPSSFRLRRAWHRYFGVLVHVSCLVFAAVHLNNFSLHQTPWWLMPFLVLPQWVTGLVLAWMRVRRGVGASMLLHSLFNGGPLLAVWIVIQIMGGVPS